MSTATEGNQVKVHYTGKLEDGTIFDSSLERDPIEFTLGEGNLIPGFEQAVTGMAIGETKTVDVPVEQAYGEYDKELVQGLSREHFPPDIELEVGQQFQGQQANGATAIFQIVGLEEGQVIVDANHPLAGQALNFEIELVEIVA